MAESEAYQAPIKTAHSGYRKAFECAPETMAPDNEFVATDDWQEIRPDQQVPAGIKINMDISTGKRFGRLLNTKKPPVEDVAYVRQYIAAKSPLNLSDESGCTLLHRAVNEGHAECVKLLCEAKADVELLNGKNSATHLAASKGDVATLTMLVESFGAKHNALNKFGKSPIHLAAYSGSLPCVKFLIGKKVSANSLTSKKETCLHLAGQKGHLEVLEYLVTTCAADVEQQDEEGKMAADVCEEYEQVATCHYLRGVLAQRAEDELLGLESPKAAGKKKSKHNEMKAKPKEVKDSKKKKGKAKKTSPAAPPAAEDDDRPRGGLTVVANSIRTEQPPVLQHPTRPTEESDEEDIVQDLADADLD